MQRHKFAEPVPEFARQSSTEGALLVSVAIDTRQELDEYICIMTGMTVGEVCCDGHDQFNIRIIEQDSGLGTLHAT